MANSAVFTTATPMIYILGAYYSTAAGPEDVLTGTFTTYDDGYGSSSGDGVELVGESIYIDGLGTFTFITAAGTDLQHILVDDGTSAWMLSDAMWVDGSVSAGGGTPYSYPVCFLPGTRLATPAGERAIETLAIGDRVSTASGAHKAIKWVGRMTLPLNRFSRATAAPVCIKAGALGNGLPQRDLYVSNDHALAIDGLLVQAGALVDGVNIVRCLDHAGDSIEYFHVELEDHDLILAEGVASESLWADEAIRAKFDNVAEFHALYPQHVTTMALDMPRVKFARQVPKALLRTLAA